MQDEASQAKSFKTIVYEGGPFPGFIEKLRQPPPESKGSQAFALGCEIDYREFGGSYIVEAPIDPDDNKGRAVWHGPDIDWEDDPRDLA